MHNSAPELARAANSSFRATRISWVNRAVAGRQALSSVSVWMTRWLHTHSTTKRKKILFLSRRSCGIEKRQNTARYLAKEPVGGHSQKIKARGSLSSFSVIWSNAESNWPAVTSHARRAEPLRLKKCREECTECASFDSKNSILSSFAFQLDASSDFDRHRPSPEVSGLFSLGDVNDTTGFLCTEIRW